MGCRDEKTKVFQRHSDNNVKIATPAESEYQIPSVTWNSELCYYFQDFWLSLLIGLILDLSGDNYFY